MSRLVSVLLVTGLLTGLAGCVASVDPTEAPEGLDIPLIDSGSVEEAGVLAFLADPATTLEVLDVDVGLDVRAARGLIAGRPFASIEEVDAVPYVGRVALAQLLEWARSGGFIPAAGDRDAAILALANDPAVGLEVLDVDVGLDRRAAQSIVDGRPFATMAQLDAASYVGPSALDKLAAYALAHGYGDADPGPGPVEGDAPCVIISEYAEGAGANNKAVEIYNCGAAPVALDRVGICLVRNADTTCSSHSLVGTGTLAPGAVWTMCRTRGGTFLDPYDALRAACDFEIGGTAIFSGNDRLVLFEDADGDGARSAADPVLDVFGDPAAPPATERWAETDMRRCDLTPMALDPDAAFTRHGRTQLDHLGVPPALDCGVSTLAGPGEDCLDADSCEAGLRCYGRPSDGSTPFGKCVDPVAVPGQGARCDQWTPCAADLICAGWTLWGEGDCNPQWMAGRFGGGALESAVPASGTLAESVVAYGLASVPVDIEVQVHVDHPRRQDLRVTLVDPNGDRAVLWDRTTELTEWSRSFVTTGGISRDDQVNGRWTLEVEDLGAGASGTLRSFSLFVVSRWD